MRTVDPHALLEQARELVELLASQPIGSRGAQVRARAEKRLERRREACGCGDCELERAIARKENADDAAYDSWRDEQIERGVRPGK